MMATSPWLSSLSKMGPHEDLSGSASMRLIPAGGDLRQVTIVLNLRS